MEKAKSQELEEQGVPTETSWIYKGRIVSLKIDTKSCSRFNRRREIVIHPGAVAILPIDEHGNLILIEQWRHATQKIMLEIPAGILEQGESPDVCAQRELQEEAGYLAKTLIPMGGVYTSPGFCNEYIHLFLAKDLEVSYLPPDECEAIDLKVLSLDKALEMIQKKEIEDSKTINAIFYYHAFLRN